jgi:pilus assembly protein Flp/PilA
MAGWVERCAYSILAAALGSRVNGLIQEAAAMALVRSFLASHRRDEDGQGLAEYALILALIAIVAIIALIFLGGQVSSILSSVGASV